MKNFKKIEEHIYMKIYSKFNERKYKYKKYNIKYIFEDNGYSDLVVVFSGCTRKGVKARYNYIKTLKNIKANKLFILDNYGYGRGIYYLGENGDFEIENGVIELIKFIMNKTNPQKTTFVGSSKGGYSAINFSMEISVDSIIIGAPQFYLGSYLNEHFEEDMVTYIMGNSNKKSIEILDNRLKNKILNSEKRKSKVYIHYSINEHTYQEHIKDLLEILNDNEFEVFCDVKDYYNHSEVSRFFPRYLLDILKKDDL